MSNDPIFVFSESATGHWPKKDCEKTRPAHVKTGIENEYLNEIRQIDAALTPKRSNDAAEHIVAELNHQVTIVLNIQAVFYI